MMADLSKRLLAIRPSDSHITAEFQRICGIKIHYHSGSNQHGSHNHHAHQNGVGANSTIANGSVSKENNGTIPNGSLVSNQDTHSSCKSNGFDHRANGIKHNGVANGYVKLEDSQPQNGLKFRHNKQTANGSATHIASENGHSTSENGQSANGHSREEDNSECTVSYTIENPILYYLFSFGANLGNEVFYVLFFSSTLWNFDSFVVRKVLIMWAVIMYFGQAAKDVIRWPRPKSPPVVRLEERYELEYGMPSTHAMVGVVIPFGMLIYMTGRYEFQFSYGLMFAILWSILVSFSRLYLGMHSVLDIVAGIGFAVFLMGVTYPFVEPVDNFLSYHPYALPVMVLTCFVLCFLYPSLDKWSTARGDTTLTLGVFSGIYAGMWLTGQLHHLDVDYFVTPELEHPPFSLSAPPLLECGPAIARQLLGVVLIVALLTALKLGILHGLAWLLGLDPKDPATKRHLAIEFSYKYVSYFVSAAATTYLMPMLFLRLGIERPSFYSEIFNRT